MKFKPRSIRQTNLSSKEEEGWRIRDEYHEDNQLSSKLLILVISLDNQLGRGKKLLRSLSEQRLSYNHIPAVLGTEACLLNPNLFDPKGYRFKHGKRPSPGELGCYLSHIKCMETFVKSEFQHALILEDDAAIGDNLYLAIEAALIMQENWDVLRLQGFHSKPSLRLEEILINNITYQLNSHFKLTTCSAAYLINRKAAESYIETLLPMSLPYDHEFILGWKYKIKLRSLNPYPINHPKSTSTIARGHKLTGLPRITTLLYRLKIHVVLALFCAWETGLHKWRKLA